MKLMKERRTRRQVLKKCALVTTASLLAAGSISFGLYNYADDHDIPNIGESYAKKLNQPLPNFDVQSVINVSKDVVRSAESLLSFSGREGEFASLIRTMIFDDYKNSRFISNGRYVLTNTEAALQLVIHDVLLATSVGSAGLTPNEGF
ncbi:hypothetical protein [Mesorhizobium sp.]|uniref:hypothetical protein n=1 Tax=Mesorhizobium sp. TaxID=1871066 RepID=UPI000FE89403|nr:hypothetical protein [Mesorhizobium sp.]RWP24891.1 MAG: hypothetical protein EOR01_04965 [Mesorhizobium sp.]RWQ31609.1 MAG: hypothetical protein EOS19_04140 [Mesorhizobium sp.]